MKYYLLQIEIFYPVLSSQNMLFISFLIHKQTDYCILNICVFANSDSIKMWDMLRYSGYLEY